MTRAPLTDRVLERVLDAIYALLDPLEVWMRRRAVEREMTAIRSTPLGQKEDTAWELLHMESGEEFTGHFAAHVLGVRNAAVAHAWLVVSGYEECGPDVWKKTTREGQ